MNNFISIPTKTIIIELVNEVQRVTNYTYTFLNNEPIDNNAKLDFLQSGLRNDIRVRSFNMEESQVAVYFWTIDSAISFYKQYIKILKMQFEIGDKHGVFGIWNDLTYKTLKEKSNIYTKLPYVNLELESINRNIWKDDNNYLNFSENKSEIVTDFYKTNDNEIRLKNILKFNKINNLKNKLNNEISDKFNDNEINDLKNKLINENKDKKNENDNEINKIINETNDNTKINKKINQNNKIIDITNDNKKIIIKNKLDFFDIFNSQLENNIINLKHDKNLTNNILVEKDLKIYINEEKNKKISNCTNLLKNQNMKLIFSNYKNDLFKYTKAEKYELFILKVSYFKNMKHFFTKNDVKLMEIALQQNQLGFLFINSKEISCGCLSNMIIQQALNIVNDENLCKIIDCLGYDIAPISATKYGAYTIQNIILHANSKASHALLSKYFEPFADFLITHDIGNYTLQKLLKFNYMLVYKLLIENINEILANKLGIKVFKKCIEFFQIHKEQIAESVKNSLSKENYNLLFNNLKKIN